MTSKSNRGWIKDPRKARPGELIGGGFFVFRRGDGTGRIRPAMWPFEHPTRESAEAEVKRLSEVQPNSVFEVFRSVADVDRQLESMWMAERVHEEMQGMSE